MSKDQLDLFTDRVQAIALFEQLSQRAAGKDWPLLPILSLVGPAGYGKSQLMQQLYFNYCHTPFLPHASIDFNRSKTPHDLLNILGALRNNLQRQRDEKGHALTFPRFDIIYARLKRSENQEQKDEIDELLGDFSDAIGLIGNLNLIVGVLLLILKLLIRIPPVRALIRFLVEQGYQQMGNRPQWRWYQDQVKKFREINLPKDASIGEILARLNEMCTAGDPERDFLIEQILPKAFLADLRYGTNDTIAPVLKSGPPCVVIFLDSFESLLRSSEKTARTLLEALALNDYRKRGESDPLLLIVGSEERLPDMSREQLRQHFTLSANRRTAFREAQLSYQGWLQQFPTQGPRPGLRLRTIYLPLTLSALPLDYTRDYLLKLDQSNDTQIFTNEALIEDMQRVTAGYPVLLERIAQALPDTLQHNLDPLTQQEPLQALLTSEMGEQIIDRQLRTHCLQAEERTFMLSALPRMLTQELLGLVLKITDSNALSDEWKRYRNLPFLLADESKKTLSFAPGIRELFLLKLRLSQQTSDYIEAHQRLRDYFQRRVEASRRATGGYDSQDMLDYCYHSLALGDYETVITQAQNSQQSAPDEWQALLRVIAEAPMLGIMQQDIQPEAAEALYQLQQQPSAELAVRAIVLYTWLLATPGSKSKAVSSLWHNLGRAFQYLQDCDPGVPADSAIYYYQRANQILDAPHEITGPLQPILPGKVQAGHTQLLPDRAQIQRLLEQAERFLQRFIRAIRSSRRLQAALTICLILSILVALLAPRLLPGPPKPPGKINPEPFPAELLQTPSKANNWIGVAVSPTGELVGLSDGTIPFDYQRPSGYAKTQAALQLRHNQLAEARKTLEKATDVGKDVNDAEAFIYLQNIKARLKPRVCDIFVVATRILQETNEGVNSGRDNLQGAYVALKQYNDDYPDAPLCLYIANLGAVSGQEVGVAQQIKQAFSDSKLKQRFKGIVGWPDLLDTQSSCDAVRLLEQAKIPIISPDSYDEAASFSNVFHVTVSNQEQGRLAARYALNTLQAQRIVILSDPNNRYSNSLGAGFLQAIRTAGGQQKLLGIRNYSTGHTDTDDFSQQLNDLWNLKPDLVYFAGSSEDGSNVLAQLSASPIKPQPHLLGGDKLYPLIRLSANARPDIVQLTFTSAAYPDTTTAQDMGQSYADAFNRGDPKEKRGYGYRLPDNTALLSYDALETLFKVYSNSGRKTTSITGTQIVNARGASRESISFTAFNALKDPGVLVLYFDKNEQVHSVYIDDKEKGTQ